MNKIVMLNGRTKEAPTKLKTVYMRGTKIVRVTRGTNLYEAGPNVVRNLQVGKYGATYAEVLDADTEQQYYSQSRSPATGQLSRPHYEWKPEDTVVRYGVSALLKSS